MKPVAFGQYTLMRKIATGGTAEIFLARRHGVDGFARHLAIKRILPHLAEDQDFVQLLVDEARLAAHLHHGHIVEIHEVDQVEGQAYIAMEYLPGGDLGRLVRAARKRKRRILVAHPDASRREALCAAFSTLRATSAPAATADEVFARSAEGAIDLAVVEASLVDAVRDRVQSAHPELLRTVVLGAGGGRGHGIYVLTTPAEDPEAVRRLAEGCLRPKLPLELAFQVIRAVADGLDYAHSATDFDGRPLNIVHRDVNPSNVLVSVNGMVKLVDFGIARAATSRRGDTKGNLVGTVHYMSPEQARGADADPRSDLFSLGTLIHELVSGVHPYQGDNQFATMRAIREDTPPALDSVVPGVPEALVEIARRASEKTADGRYARAEDMLAEVEHFVRREGLNLSPKRMAGFMQVVYGKHGLGEFGVSGTGYEVVRPAATPSPRARGAEVPISVSVSTPTPHLDPIEVEIALDDIEVPVAPAPMRTPEPEPHPVEAMLLAQPSPTDEPVHADWRGSDNTLRILLTLLIVALVAVAGWYLHWRSASVQAEGSAAEIEAQHPG
jgi:serine/threonine protein kinase